MTRTDESFILNLKYGKFWFMLTLKRCLSRQNCCVYIYVFLTKGHKSHEQSKNRLITVSQTVQIFHF